MSLTYTGRCLPRLGLCCLCLPGETVLGLLITDDKYFPGRILSVYQLPVCPSGGLWSALTLGYSSLTAGSGDEPSAQWPPVAAQSLLLLLVLGNHCTAADPGQHTATLDNTYRRAMFEMANFHGKLLLMT